MDSARPESTATPIPRQPNWKATMPILATGEVKAIAAEKGSRKIGPSTSPATRPQRMRRSNIEAQ